MNKFQVSLLVTCCSIMLAVMNASSTDPKSSTGVSNKKVQHLNERISKPADLQVSATVSGQVLHQSSQPRENVYYSTIDRTIASNQMRPANQIVSVSPTTSDLATAAGHHHGHAYGKYYEYREVPKKKTWKFGYKRGNHKHTISRHEHGKAGKKHSHFKTKVKWHDKKSKGKGIHLWDYNHHDKKHHYG